VVRCEGTGAPELGLAFRCEDECTPWLWTSPLCRPTPKMVYRWARRERPPRTARCDGQTRRSATDRARAWSLLVRAIAANHVRLRRDRDYLEAAGEC